MMVFVSYDLVVVEYFVDQVVVMYLGEKVEEVLVEMMFYCLVYFYSCFLLGVILLFELGVGLL